MVGIFSPPPNWEYIILPETPPCIKATFVGESSSPLKPSINIAQENISISEEAYLKAVKAIHDEEPNTKWKKTGKITTQVGIATLAEIDSKNSLGDLKMIQMILIKDKVAYIITGAAVKEDFPKIVQQLLQSCRSFHFEEKRMKPIPNNMEKSKAFKELKKQMTQEQWEYLKILISTNTYTGKSNKK